MSFLKYIILFATLTAPFMVVANSASVDDKLSMSASRSVQISAEVKSIDYATRSVTLMAENGSEYSFIASEQIRHLDQVSVGDIIEALYQHAIEITLLDATDMPAGDGQADMLARRKKGEKPGVQAAKTRIRVLTVTDIDLESNTFKLRNKEGVENVYVARDPRKLKQAAVGDVVRIVDTRSLLLGVDNESDQ